MAEHGTRRQQDVMTIGYCEDDEAVCVAVFSRTVMVFCKKSYRRRGYGSACVKTLMPHLPKEHWADEGVLGSRHFWEELRMPYNRRQRHIELQ
jgi:hypothetical protein